jgi:quercetin dioxygenase-like cupin family protein
MIRSGDILHNPVTGETIRFVEAAVDTDGEYTLIDVTVEPNGCVAAAHMHPLQTEAFRVLDGELNMKHGRKTIAAAAGETVVVEPGIAHTFWNAGDNAVRFTCEVRPALGFERLIETMFALAADGKTNAKGMPNPFRLAVIAKTHFDDVRLPFPPVWMQRAGLALGAPLGRLLGYRATYDGSDPGDPSLAI